MVWSFFSEIKNQENLHSERSTNQHKNTHVRCQCVVSIHVPRQVRPIMARKKKILHKQLFWKQLYINSKQSAFYFYIKNSRQNSSPDKCTHPHPVISSMLPQLFPLVLLNAFHSHCMKCNPIGVQLNDHFRPRVDRSSVRVHARSYSYRPTGHKRTFGHHQHG